jgi:mannose-6-phosphate isomerase-like protein (cupin superfamily)
MSGVKDRRCDFSPGEIGTLRALQRGVFIRSDAPGGARVVPENVFYAIPTVEGQIVANDLSKYTDFYLTEPRQAKQAVTKTGTRRCEKREQLDRIISEVKKLLKRSKVVVPGQLELEVSHHYGIDNFSQFGSVVITVVNREYCKRVIVVLPGQTHPEQFHRKKDETYHILHGEIILALDGVERTHKANDVVIIPREMRHKFTTRTGTVIEEVSSAYDGGDSFYTDPTIEANTNRKTYVTYWMD